MVAKRKIVSSIAFFILVAVSAWPAYVAASLSVSFFLDTLGILDFIDLQPKRLALSNFIHAWLSSIPLAAGLGLLAVIDMQLLMRKRSTYFLAGITLPLASIGLGLALFQNSDMELIPVFAGTGMILWVVYRVTALVLRTARA